jgi:hypothetical protein
MLADKSEAMIVLTSRLLRNSLAFCLKPFGREFLSAVDIESASVGL